MRASQKSNGSAKKTNDEHSTNDERASDKKSYEQPPTREQLASYLDDAADVVTKEAATLFRAVMALSAILARGDHNGSALHDEDRATAQKHVAAAVASFGYLVVEAGHMETEASRGVTL